MSGEKEKQIPSEERANAEGPGHPVKYPRRIRRLAVVFAVLFLFAIFMFAPFTAGVRSLAAMSLYDLYCEKSSLPSSLGLNVEMPYKNMDFYPLMLTFSDNAGMSAWLDKPVRFTVDYTVADFSFLSGHSRFFERESPLYNAYIGAYYVQGMGSPASAEDVFNIAAFDQRCLALPALGCNETVFEASQISQSDKTIEFAGCVWQRYDAALITNGPEHQKKGFQRGYILFGDPPQSSEDYPLRNMRGRIYATYIIDKDLTVALYALAKDETVIDEIDNKILSKTRLTWKDKK